MDCGKYVVFENGLQGEFLIAFTAQIEHRDMARRFPHSKPVAAGFIRINDKGELSCHGMSESLKIGSRPAEDTALANFMLRGA